MCFVWILEQTAIISLYSINWLVCITERESVYCAVRSECLCVIQVNIQNDMPTSDRSCVQHGAIKRQEAIRSNIETTHEKDRTFIISFMLY